MGIRSTTGTLVMIGLAIMAVVEPLAAGGLRTQLGEVVIENLQLGQTYNLKDLANLSLNVGNTSEFTLNIQMDVLVPSPGELRLESRAIPDVSWIELTGNRFEVKPGAQASTDILISIPDDDVHFGQKYQVVIWSHSLAEPGRGMSLAYGLKSRIIFSIDPNRADPEDLAMTSNGDAGFVVGPQEIRVHDVVAGESWNLAEHGGVVLTVSNPGHRPRTVQLVSQAVSASNARLTEGYEDTPDPSFLTFNETELVLSPGEHRDVRMFLDFPQDAYYSGHKYMFIIHAVTRGEQVSTGVYSRLYATVK